MVRVGGVEGSRRRRAEGSRRFSRGCLYTSPGQSCSRGRNTVMLLAEMKIRAQGAEE